jgi:hypothetical protein
MQNYIFLLNKLNNKAKKYQFHVTVTFRKLLCGMATIYIVQCGITGYPKDVAFADLIAAKTNTISSQLIWTPRNS